MPSLQQADLPRENNFTFLRLLAAWMVLFSHAFGILNKGELQPAIKVFGGSILLSHLGLFFFFTVSGFLVSKSYHQASSASHFLLKRFLRIFPGLAGVNVFCIILGGFVSSVGMYAYYTNFSTWSYLIVNLSLLRIQYELPGVFENLNDHSINASLWTILLEVKFYILLLFAGLIGLLSNMKILITGFILFCVLYFLYNYSIIPKVHFVELRIYFWLGIYFYAGVILYHTINLIKYRWAAFFILLILALLFSKTTLHPITTCFFLSYTFLCVAIGHPLFKSFNIDISYGFYLYSFPIQQLLVLYLGYDISVWWFIVISTLLTFIPAFISWKFIENPWLLKKDYFLKRSDL